MRLFDEPPVDFGDPQQAQRITLSQRSALVYQNTKKVRAVRAVNRRNIQFATEAVLFQRWAALPLPDLPIEGATLPPWVLLAHASHNLI